MDFLELATKNVVVVGVANRRSVAFAVSRVLEEAGAHVIHVVRDEDVRNKTATLLAGRPVYTCNVESEQEIAELAERIAAEHAPVYGLVHSIAFANYSDGFCPFHETKRQDFLQAVDISCFSLVALANALAPHFEAEGAMVTISISTTRMASESYGYMGPVKAALDSTVAFLAKSLSTDRRIRVNAVGAGLLKTSSSAGIPGYVDAFLHAEEVIPRGKALATTEVANTVAFLLSPRSSGINAQTVVTDAGMSVNHFDTELVRRSVMSRHR